MRLTDILHIDCVKVSLASETKQDAIYELVDLLGNRRGIRETERLKCAVWERELTRTTGIGHGIAIPHGKCIGCRKLHMAIGRPCQPLDFGAIDGEPVDLIFLLASPLDQTGPHIQALAQLSRMLTDQDFRHDLKRANTAEEIYELIQQREAK